MVEYLFKSRCFSISAKLEKFKQPAEKIFLKNIAKSVAQLEYPRIFAASKKTEPAHGASR